MTAGQLLSRTLSTFFKNFVPFTATAAVLHIPLIVAAIMMDPGTGQELYVDLLGALLAHLVTGALIYGVVERLRGRSPSMSESAAVGFKRFFPVLAVSVLSGLAIFGGTLLFILPGLVMSCMLFVAVPVAVIENPGVMASLKRSAKLTRGALTIVFALAFAIGALKSGARAILTTLAQERIITDVLTLIVLVLAVEIVFAALSAVAAGVVYADLREQQEGVDVDELAAAFS